MYADNLSAKRKKQRDLSKNTCNSSSYSYRIASMLCTYYLFAYNHVENTHNIAAKSCNSGTKSCSFSGNVRRILPVMHHFLRFRHALISVPFHTEANGCHSKGVTCKWENLSDKGKPKGIIKLADDKSPDGVSFLTLSLEKDSVVCFRVTLIMAETLKREILISISEKGAGGNNSSLMSLLYYF